MCMCVCVLSHMWADHSNSILCVYILCMHVFLCGQKLDTVCVHGKVSAALLWTGTHPNCPAGYTQNNQCLKQELMYHTNTHALMQNVLLANMNSQTIQIENVP